MTKKLLQLQIEDLRKSEALHLNIIKKLILDYIQIKPIPKGRVKDRIIVFVKECNANNIDCECLIALKNLNVKNNLTFGFKPTTNSSK